MIPSYRRLLGVLIGAFLLTPFLSFLMFGSWSILDLLYAPFFAPALGGSFLIQAGLRFRPRELLATSALGVALTFLHAYLGRVVFHQGAGHLLLHALVGFGAASVLHLAGLALRAKGDARSALTSLLVPGLILPLFVGSSTLFLGLTAVLHPTVYDALIYAADRVLGVEPSFAAGVLFQRSPLLADLCELIYGGLPLAVALVYMLRRRAHGREQADVLLAFIAVGLAGFLLYHLFPVAGPVYFFAERYPGDPLVLRPAAVVLPNPIVRNCMPSLHTAWALLLFWYSRGLRPWARLVMLGWLLGTLLATLGFGFHYAMDLVVAFPFTLAVRAAFASSPPRLRRGTWLCATLATAAWLALLRFFPPHGANPLPWRWLLAALTVTGTLWAESRLELSEGSAPSAAPPAARVGWSELGIASLFFVSGLSALIYEVLFAKTLSLTFGSTATASATVLAAYMGGMSIGSWLGGELGQRRSDSLRIYASCELLIAVYCALTPWLFSGVRQLYVALAAGSDPGRPWLVALQIALGTLVMLPATILMGITLPVLAKHFAARGALGRTIGLLYGANTLGAALGALLTGYLILPFFGVRASTWLAVVGNLIVGYAALKLSQRPSASGGAPPAPAVDNDAPPARAATLATALLAVGGVITLALETTDVHLLSVVAGNSAYAFSLMLFAFLLGLGLGAHCARQLLLARPARLLDLSLSECALGLTILLSVFAWAGIPEYFSSFARYPGARSFESRELVRFVVCALVLTPQAACIGFLYPLAFDLLTRAAPSAAIRSTGRASALNTLGNILGAVAGGLWLVPKLGSLHVLELLGAGALLLAVLPLAWLPRAQRAFAGAAALAAFALFAALPKQLDYDRLATGANVYFAASSYGRVIAHAESLDGGLTTVNESEQNGQTVLTLLTNGKFQGDDGGEMKSQVGFSLYPLLHTSARDSALVIGLGTGVSASTVHRAGFRKIDVAELSPDIVTLADRYFSHVNGAVLHQPGVTLHLSDGRNFLLLGRERYDLITIEVTSIWFAGAASLYSDEFYQLVRASLKPHGVFQQWIQLHHISSLDVGSVLSTLRHQFPYVSLYFSGAQGVLVACVERCAPNPGTLAAIDQAPGLQGLLASLHTSAGELARDRLLAPRGVDRFIPELGGNALGLADLISTDDNLLLEYSTPRGNVRDYQTSLALNLELLRPFIEEGSRALGPIKP